MAQSRDATAADDRERSALERRVERVAVGVATLVVVDLALAMASGLTLASAGHYATLWRPARLLSTGLAACVAVLVALDRFPASYTQVWAWSLLVGVGGGALARSIEVVVLHGRWVAVPVASVATVAIVATWVVRWGLD